MRNCWNSWVCWGQPLGCLPHGMQRWQRPKSVQPGALRSACLGVLMDGAEVCMQKWNNFPALSQSHLLSSHSPSEMQAMVWRWGWGGDWAVKLRGVVVLCLPRARRPHQPAVPQHHGALGAGAVDAAPRRHHGLQADSRAHQGRAAPHLQRGTLCHQVPAEEPAAWHRVHRVPGGCEGWHAEQQRDRRLHHLWVRHTHITYSFYTLLFFRTCAESSYCELIYRGSLLK